MAILPDDIKDLKDADPNAKIDTTYAYIQYMKEQIEFWGKKRQEEIRALQDKMDSIIGGN